MISEVPRNTRLDAEIIVGDSFALVTGVRLSVVSLKGILESGFSIKSAREVEGLGTRSTLKKTAHSVQTIVYRLWRCQLADVVLWQKPQPGSRGLLALSSILALLSVAFPKLLDLRKSCC